MGSKKVSPHFWEGHGGSNPHLAFLDQKSTEKPTYALNGHGSAINDPTIYGRVGVEFISVNDSVDHPMTLSVPILLISK